MHTTFLLEYFYVRNHFENLGGKWEDNIKRDSKYVEVQVLTAASGM